MARARRVRRRWRCVAGLCWRRLRGSRARTSLPLASALNQRLKRRGRFARRGLDGLHDDPRPRKPRSINDEDVERVIVKTLEEKPRDATHWSTRSMAHATGMSQTAVSRIWRAFGLKPIRVELQALIRPLFIEKVRHIVGLYLNPPDAARVVAIFCCVWWGIFCVLVFRRWRVCACFFVCGRF